MNKDYTISVLGLGYVGLTIAATYAEQGFEVNGVDNSQSVISDLKNGRPHFYENGLEELLKKVSRKLNFSINLEVQNKPTVFIVAVGTSLLSNGQPDYAQIDSAVGSISKILKIGDVVILRSTVVVGTTKSKVVDILEDKTSLSAGKDFYVGFAPERTIEGKALEELRTLPQVVAGLSPGCLEIIRKFFLVITPTVLDAESLEAAELVKLVSNAHRDVNFAFANSVALAASENNIDAHSLISTANYGYNRNHIALPSPGVGGYCLTKDPQLFAASVQSSNKVQDFMLSGRAINDSMPSLVAKKVSEYINVTQLKTKLSIGVVGLAFKSHPPTSDVRFSPSLSVIEIIAEIDEISNLYAYDELVEDQVFKDYGLTKCKDLKDIFCVSDIVIFMHNSPFLQEELVKKIISNRPADQLVIDTWGIYYDLHLPLPRHKYSSLTYKNF